MNPIDANSLREIITALPADNKRLEWKKLRELIQLLSGDLREALNRGVMPRTLAEILSDKTGMRIKLAYLRKVMKASEHPARKDAPRLPKEPAVPKQKPAPRDKRRGRKGKDPDHAASISAPPDAGVDLVDELLRRHRPEDRVPAAQPMILGICRGANGAAHVLCHSGKISKTLRDAHGGAFGVYAVDSEGYILPVRHLPEGRKMGVSRDEAIERFRQWADANFCSSPRIFDRPEKGGANE